jgi:hypothetical protein
VTKPFSIAPAALTYITLEFGGWAKSTQWLKVHVKGQSQVPQHFALYQNEKC